MPSYHIDEDVVPALARRLRECGRSAVSAKELGANGYPDYWHISHAAQNGRTLVTHNWRDFPLLHGAWLHWTAVLGYSPSHSGILVLAQVRVVDDLLAALLDFEAKGYPLHGNLYRWKPSTGWKQHLPYSL